MTRKMNVPRIGAGMLLLFFLTSCVRRPYYATGGPGPLSVAGQYEMSESLYSNTCGPGVLPRKEILRVKVEHNVGAGFAKIVVNDRSVYDAVIRADGNFTVGVVRGGDARGSYSRMISGNFTDTAMYARVMVDSVKPIAMTGRPQGAGDESLRDCKYQLRWDAKKL